MLVEEFRPREIKDLRGQENVRLILSKISEDPFNSPRNILLYGPPGTGKTSSARIFKSLLNNAEYVEYDSAVIGNAEDMTEIIRYFPLVKSGKDFKIVVFDEIQEASKKAQNLLIKPLEESNKNIFYIFCTTDINKIIDTIKSRCLLLEFTSIPNKIMSLHLSQIFNLKKGEGISKESMRIIIRRSEGRLRNALNELEKLILLGEEDYLKNNYLLDTTFVNLFDNINNVEVFKELLNKILLKPSHIIKQDFDAFIVKASELTFVNKNNTGFEKLIFNYLRHQQYLLNSSHWNAFFNTIRNL
jgi:DNA polymerase III gamma/tau subunit